MQSTLPALPMLRMEPALPILRTLPALPMLRTLPMLPMLKMLPALRRLRMLSTLAMLLRLNRLVPANLPCAQGARLGPRLDGRRPKGRATRAPLEAISGREASARGRCIGIELSFPWAARLRGIVPPAQSVASRATTLHGPCRISV